jgi:hypothetical protein
MAVGPLGELYISDTQGHRVLRITDDGRVNTVAGTGVDGYAGDGGPAILAQMRSPGALAVSVDGELYIAEFGRVRRVGRDGRIVTVANEHANGLAFDRMGNLFVSSNRYVYLLAAGGGLLRIAGSEGGSTSDEAGVALGIRIGEARGIAVSQDNEVFIADAAQNRVRRLTRNRPSALTLVSGGDQSVQISKNFERVVLKVLGRSGPPVRGISVRFKASGGVTVPATAGTNDAGEVSIVPVAGTVAGDYVVTAETTGAPAVEIRLRVTE